MNSIPLYYLCSVSGLILVIGGIWLLAKRKIYLKAETNEVIAIQLPRGIRFKTNVPVLGLIGLGCILLLLPIFLLGSPIEPSKVVRGSIKSSIHPVIIYASIRTEAVQQDGTFSLTIPCSRLPGYTSKLLYVAGSIIFADSVASETNGCKDVSLVEKVIRPTESTDTKAGIPATASLYGEVKAKPAIF